MEENEDIEFLEASQKIADLVLNPKEFEFPAVEEEN